MQTRRQFALLSAGALMAPKTAFGDTMCMPPIQGVSACTTGVQNVPIVTQDCPQWCWAACAELLFALQGYDVPQQWFVQKVHNGILNCQPAVGPTIAGAISGNWVDASGTAFQAFAEPLMDLDHFPQISHPSPMDVVRDELDANRAVIAGTLGHAIAITALEYYENSLGQRQLQNVIVRDPFPYRAVGMPSPYFNQLGPNKFSMTPQQFFNGSLLMTVKFS